MAIRTVSATEAKNRFGAVVKIAREEVDAVLVENRGQPYAAILSPAEFERLQEADRELRRRVQVERLDDVMRQQAALNQHLSPDEAEALAVRAVRADRDRAHARGERS